MLVSEEVYSKKFLDKKKGLKKMFLKTWKKKLAAT